MRHYCDFKMKVALLFLIALLPLLCAADDDESQPKKVKYDKLSRWRVGTCQRPHSGKCSQAKTCCNKKMGFRMMMRECLGDNCNPKPSRVRRLKCVIKCGKDFDKMSKWTFSKCLRPDSGECASALTCCSQKIGTRKMTRRCLGKNCNPEMDLEKTMPCNINCNMEGRWTDWISSDCSVSCGKGVITHTRQCLGNGKCEGDATKQEACQQAECECPNNQKFNECGSACPLKCGEEPVACVKKCVRGCACPPGLLWMTESGDCVAEGECPAVVVENGNEGENNEVEGNEVEEDSE